MTLNHACTYGDGEIVCKNLQMQGFFFFCKYASHFSPLFITVWYSGTKQSIARLLSV